MEATECVTALGYIGVRSARLDDWDSYATKLLGMQKVDRAGAVRAFRMDDRRQRLVVTVDEGEGLGFMGWETADAAALAALAARLDAHGVPVQQATQALADERRVADLLIFADPAANRLEAFHGPQVTAEPSRPGRPISGFRTGPLGMGHAVINVEGHRQRMTARRSCVLEGDRPRPGLRLDGREQRVPCADRVEKSRQTE